MSIQQQFTQQFQTLATRHIIFGIQKPLIVCEDFIVICFQKFGAQYLVACEQFLKYNTLVNFALNATKCCKCTLNVEKASEAMSKVDTSTYRKKLKNSFECNMILASASYRAHSRNIVPQFRAISWCSQLPNDHRSVQIKYIISLSFSPDLPGY